MPGRKNSQTWTQSGATAKVVSASRHNVLHTSPLNNTEKISRYLESSVGHSRQDKVSNGRAEADSDSGDSLFITQKPVPEAARSGRRCRHGPTVPSDHGESGEDSSSSSSSSGEPKTDKQKRKMKKFMLPEYRFLFLTERNCHHRKTYLLPVQNATLHHYVMGGFFKCARELWRGGLRGEDLQSSLPTVDTDGESIPPLSEEDEERPEDEDIRVVERKHFVASSKAKSQQTWCNQVKPQKKKAANTSQETAQGRQTKVLNKLPVQVVAAPSDAQRSDDGERERTDERATTVGNLPPQTETPKSTRRLSRGNKKVILRREDDEPRELWRSPRQSEQKGREASAAVTEPPSDNVFQTGQAGDAPESPSLLLSLPNNDDDDGVCNETKVKKRKKKKKDKGDHESVEKGEGQSHKEADAATAVNAEGEETEENGAEPPGSNEETGKLENLTHDDTLLREEDRDTASSKPKKKKKRKRAAENDQVDGNLESDVREEDSGLSVSCDVQDGGEEKKKKKRKRSEQIEVIECGAVVESLNAEIHKKKKKKRKKEETEECEEEEAPNVTLSASSAEPVEESGNSLETLEVNVKRKKHKKKRLSSFNDAAQDGEETVDLNFCIDDSVTSAKGSGTAPKKRKKTVFEGLDVFNAPERLYENMGDTLKTKEGTEDQNAKLVTKKKKKKKSEISSRSISEDSVALSDDSVSAREKETKRSSSFLAADAEENSAQTLSRDRGAETPGDVEELNDGVRKKKKKRKKSVVQDSVEKDPRQESEEPNKTCLTETTDTGVKRKKKHAGNESETSGERLESAADEGLCPADEAAVLKKKKKKKKSKDQVMTQEKGEISSEETANMVEHTSDTPGHALNDIRVKKKKKKTLFTDVLLEGKL